LEEFMAKRFEMKLIFPVANFFASSSLEEEKKKDLAEHGAALVSAIGAALVKEDGLNLIPDEIRRRNAQMKNEKLLQAGWIAAAAVLCLLLLATWFRVGTVGVRIQSTDKKWEKIESSRKLLEDIAFRENVRHSAMKNDLAYAALLTELGRLTPPAFVLDEARFARQDGLLVLTGESYELGKENLRLTTKFVNALSGSSFFRSVMLAGTTQETKEQKFRFEIHCVLKGVT
jgi:Tfp pilus assembly protein PilN